MTDFVLSPLGARTLVASGTAMLERACAFDRASRVGDEKLVLGDPAAPTVRPSAFEATRASGEACGLAAVSGNRIRLLAVDPSDRGKGIGTALLDACLAAARAAGQTRLRTLDQPGNYLAPGIDVENVETIEWLKRRGWTITGEPRHNVLLDVRNNPHVTEDRARDSATAARARGYEIRRATLADESLLLTAIAKDFGGTWPYEVARALRFDGRAPAHGLPTGGLDEHAGADEITPTRVTEAMPRGEPAVHVVLKDGELCAFAAHDGNNQGLGWFGPTGTWPAHRGKGLGEALLLACLVDVARHHAQCEVAWIGPRPFYERVAGGIARDRTFVVLARDL